MPTDSLGLGNNLFFKIEYSMELVFEEFHGRKIISGIVRVCHVFYPYQSTENIDSIIFLMIK